MLLTPEQIFGITKRGTVQFDILWSPLHGGGDWVTYSAEGVKDFNKLIETMASGTEHSARFKVEVMVGLNDEGERSFDLEDLVALRDQFIAFWGPVNKINEYGPKPTVAFETPIQP